jgi:hypothetical protein
MDALGVTLAVIELGKVASLASNFVVTDFCFGFQLNGLCFHDVLLSEKADS